MRLLSGVHFFISSFELLGNIIYPNIYSNAKNYPKSAKRSAGPGSESNRLESLKVTAYSVRALIELEGRTITLVAAKAKV